MRDRTAGVFVGVVFAVFAVLAAARPASAQSETEHASISAGYQLVHIPNKTFPWGIGVDVALPLRINAWALVGEFDWAHDSRNEANGTTAVNFFNFGGGLRWSRTHHGAKPYAQLLLGATHSTANLRDASNPTGTRAADTTGFMLQPGIGVAAPFGRKWSGVVQGDYRRSFFSGEGENELRLFVGLRRAIHGA